MRGWPSSMLWTATSDWCPHPFSLAANTLAWIRSSAKFVESAKLHPDAACFGVPGPVRNGRVETSNLPWVIESARLADELNLTKTVLINDLEANAWGIAALDPEDVVSLNQVKGNPEGNQAVISAGTGLGEAGMYWDGSQYRIFAYRGWPCRLCAAQRIRDGVVPLPLRPTIGHVSYERIVSGSGPGQRVPLSARHRPRN